MFKNLKTSSQVVLQVVLCLICVISICMDTHRLRADFLCMASSCTETSGSILVECSTVISDMEWLFLGYMIAVTLSIVRMCVVISILCTHWSLNTPESQQWKRRYTSGAAWTFAASIDGVILIVLAYRLIAIQMSLGTYVTTLFQSTTYTDSVELVKWPHVIAIIGASVVTVILDVYMLAHSIKSYTPL